MNRPAVAAEIATAARPSSGARVGCKGASTPKGVPCTKHQQTDQQGHEGGWKGEHAAAEVLDPRPSVNTNRQGARDQGQGPDPDHEGGGSQFHGTKDPPHTPDRKRRRRERRNG